MIKKNMPIQGSTVTILGFTFKENVPDLRNTRVIDIVNELKEFDVNMQITDAYAESGEAQKEYGVELIPYAKVKPADAVVFVLPHETYSRKGWTRFVHVVSNGTC